MTTTDIDKEFDNIAAIRSRMIDAVKVQLHTGMEGFDPPKPSASIVKPEAKHLEQLDEYMNRLT